MEKDYRKYVLLGSIPLFFLITLFYLYPVLEGPPNTPISEGVWNNCNFTKPPEEWSAAAKSFGGEDGVVDLVVAQAHANELTYLPFPFEKRENIYSYNQTDKVEPYLKKFDEDGLKVILSIQPNGADVADLIEIILSRYGHHESIIGVNVDIEWKLTGNPYHVSNKERDLWLNIIQSHDPEFKLFLTYFKDHTYFPDDAHDVVILFDGNNATQGKLMKNYKELASHYTSAGIYTGYPSSIPPTASHDNITAAAPNTEYILYIV
jgi:hypothetical protein